MAALIDTVLKVLKWPMAILSLLWLPGAAGSILAILPGMWAAPGPLVPFAAGAGLYGVAWWVLFRRPGLGSLLSTLEHELTHALFALATFRLVTGLTTSWKSGGHVTFEGRANWLILTAPYFFPTVSVAVMALAMVTAPQFHDTMGAVLGATVAYHVTSTWRETHPGQSDLQRVSLPFACLFLPGANLLGYASVIHFTWGGWVECRGFWTDSLERTLHMTSGLAQLARGLLA